jgi:hypothetical protein
MSFFLIQRLADDDVPMRPDPVDDALSSAQSRRYHRQENKEASDVS